MTEKRTCLGRPGGDVTRGLSPGDKISPCTTTPATPRSTETFVAVKWLPGEGRDNHAVINASLNERSLLRQPRAGNPELCFTLTWNVSISGWLQLLLACAEFTVQVVFY